MSETLWAHRPRPATGPGASVVGRWTPANVADLTAHRRQLGAALGANAHTAAGERLLLAFEELVSNGLRHGAGTVEVTVTADPDGWLLEVSDDAGNTPPELAVDRDAALGGLGLHLVAQLSAAHGWTADPRTARKVVWACVELTDRESPADGAPTLPRPRIEAGVPSRRRR